MNEPIRIDVHVHELSTHEIEEKLDHIINFLRQMETKIMASLDETLAAVTAESTVDDSIIALLEGLAAQIKAGGLSAADQAKVDRIFAQAQNNSAKVTAAVLANTPPPPPVALAIATTSPLPDGTVGTAYSGAFSATGGTAPYTFSGTAPSEFTLGSDGTLTGTPSVAGSYSFDVTVTDSAAPPATATSTFALTVN